MIKFLNNNNSEVYEIFRSLYSKALNANQQLPEAISISSFNKEFLEVNARFVNLKIVDNEDFIFFTNYNSPKAKEFNSHNQIAVSIFWNSINIQIRMKARIKSTSRKLNIDYFRSRSIEKNILAISSNQSNTIESYDEVINKFNKVKKRINSDTPDCPKYWGGFAFRPYEIEFWEGNKFRLNNRNLFTLSEGEWKNKTLEP